jgi:hypothetical protein
MMIGVPKHFEAFVLPVCTFSIKAGEAAIEQAFGTAFLINGLGYFMTAAHVIEQALRASEKSGHTIGLLGKANDGENADNVFLPILWQETAPKPFDVAIGHLPYKAPTLAIFGELKAASWQDVACIGYPTSAITRDIGVWINVRTLKGYIQRNTAPRDIHFGEHPNGFELSFQVSPGMSGGPVFVMTPSGFHVIGVAVSSFRGVTTEAEYSEVLEDGTVFKETRLRIEEFGLAHDIAGLLDWKPSALDGQSLRDIVFEAQK